MPREVIIIHNGEVPAAVNEKYPPKSWHHTLITPRVLDEKGVMLLHDEATGDPIEVNALVLSGVNREKCLGLNELEQAAGLTAVVC